MKMSKSLFVVFVLSVLSLMLSSMASAAPVVTVSGVPSTAAPGASFTVTASAYDYAAGRSLSSISLVNSYGWIVSPASSPCYSASCTASFVVTVPSTVTTGTYTFTVQSSNNYGEVGYSSPAYVTVSGVASYLPTITFASVSGSAMPNSYFDWTVTATSTYAVTQLTLSNSLGWSVTPLNSCTGSTTCSITFRVYVPSTAVNGQQNTFTASAVASGYSNTAVQTVTVGSTIPVPGTGVVATPGVSLSGVPQSVLQGSSFSATVVATAAAGRAVNSITLVNTAGWTVSPANTITCDSGAQVCTAAFSVAVPSTASTGTSVTFTATATTNVAGETLTDSKVTYVSGGPSTAGKTPITIEAVEIDGFTLSSSNSNIRDLERGQSFDLKVNVRAVAAAKDVEVRAFVTGYQFSTNEPISDSTSPFDVQPNTNYVRTLKLTLPDRADEDTYRIRIVVAGRDNDEVVQNYRIKITPSDHEVIIRELSITPESVQAGRAVLATVRVKNLGSSTERDVKLAVSIPQLGVTATPDYVDSIKSDESVTSEEFFLRLDSCAKPGTYNVKAEVTFEEGDKTVTASKQLTVTAGACTSTTTTPAQAAGMVRIAYTAEPQNVNAGGEAAAYVITISNDGDTAKTYTLSAAGADWATVKFSPSNMVTVKGGDSQTAYVYVSANRNAAQGGQGMIVRVKDMSGEVVKELPLSANIIGAAGTGTGLVQVMQFGLIAVIVVLVIVAIVVALKRMKGPKEGEEGTQTYY